MAQQDKCVVLNKKERVKIITNLKRQREKIGLTQVAVAKKAGIAVRSYQYIEAEQRLPNVITAIRIAKALQSSCEELYLE